VRLKFIRLDEAGVVLKERRSGELVIAYEEILTAERLRSWRGGGVDLHVRGTIEPVRVRCGRANRQVVESGLRSVGVRIVDCLGAIIAPTLLEFEEELAREPVGVRQLSDNA
jgi:hypothetical protein